jgi:DNA-binding response OmpR family regulator
MMLVWQLRRKIDKDFKPNLIHTARGIGYFIDFIVGSQGNR